MARNSHKCVFAQVMWLETWEQLYLNNQIALELGAKQYKRNYVT